MNAIEDVQLLQVIWVLHEIICTIPGCYSWWKYWCSRYVDVIKTLGSSEKKWNSNTRIKETIINSSLVALLALQNSRKFVSNMGQ